MPSLSELKDNLLDDRKITKNEVRLIADYIASDGQLDLNDVKFLVELLCSANEVCPEFDDLFFPVLKQAILADGKIGQDEQFYLLKMLYSDGQLRPVEKEFLKELYNEVDEVTPDFETLYQTAMAAPERNWSVGGQQRAFSPAK